MQTREVVDERQRLWRGWLDLPWDLIRQDIVSEMQARGMTWDDLLFELRTEGYRVSRTTLWSWIGGHSVKGPPIEALQALVRVFGRVRSGDWTKGAEFSPYERGADPESPRGRLEQALADAERRTARTS